MYMGSSPNNPDINGKYNYVYKITNLINRKEYIGVHRTENINDGYMGSGVCIKRSIKKHGIENFKKKIIAFFVTYREALAFERQLVTEEYINTANTYNLKEGGSGNAKWAKVFIKTLSKGAFKRWRDPDYRQRMIASFNSPKCRKARSEGIKNWIKNNPKAHAERMDKINKNPDKIKKTADAHRGTKRSMQACKNISKAMLKKLKEDPVYAAKFSGKGKHYIYNPISKEVKRIKKDEFVPEGWVVGSGPKKNRSNYKDMNRGSVFAFHSTTLQIKRYQQSEQIPPGWTLGRPKK